MRVRILRQSSGIIEGVSLSALHPGVTYDVSEPLATFLITTGAAFFVASDQPAVVVPLGNPQRAVSPAPSPLFKVIAR